MLIFPAIDIIDGMAVRLAKGDYNEKTVYNTDPAEVAEGFYASGARYLHIVDLDGAKSGRSENFAVIEKTVTRSGLLVEVGGGIRDMETVDKYFSSGVFRVIIGTAAVTDPEFLCKAVEKYGDKIAVGADIKDGFVAIKGWTQTSDCSCIEFCKKMQNSGVNTLICTDISKDGMLSGANHELYKMLSNSLKANIVASGGVTTYEDIVKLKEMQLYGAILGKALYEKKIVLEDAIALAEEK